MIKLLHVTATHLKPDGGVPVVLKELVEEQNRIEGFVAKVVSLVAPVDAMNSEYFYYITPNEFENFVLEYKPSVVILHSFFYLEYNHVVKILIKFGIRYLIEPHGSFVKTALRKSFFKKKIANNTIFRKQIKNCYGYIFLNETEKENSKYHSYNDIIIPNGIKSSNVKKTHYKNNFSFYFIGRYDIKHKGMDYLLKALKIFDQYSIKITINMWGKGNKKTLRYIKKRIRTLKNVVVNCNDSIYGKEKEETLEQLGPMLLTSRYEGFPMSILEAWSYGNPCIVSPGTNVTKEVQENNLGWITTLNPRSIAETMRQAYYDYINDRDSYIENCKTYVTRSYVWSSIALTSSKLLKEIGSYNS